MSQKENCYTSNYAIGTSGINQDDVTTSEDEETIKHKNKNKKRKTNKHELDMKSYAEIFYDFMQEEEEDKKMGQV